MNIKIFTTDKFMWSGTALPGKKEYFGYGSFKSTNTSYTGERIFYSKSMESHAPIHTVKLELSDTIYSQIHSDSLGPYYAEKYRKIDSYNYNNSKLSIQGVWQHESAYVYAQNKIVDTILISNNEPKIKIFTSHKYMWAKHTPKDTVECYGYGNYQLNKDFTILTETLEYASNSMAKYDKERQLILVLENDRFSQISRDKDGNKQYSENYIKIGL